MNGRRGLLLATISVLAPAWAIAQSTLRVRRIGVLANSQPRSTDFDPMNAFKSALRDLGWIEGQNVTFEFRFANQNYERFPELARELVNSGVDLILVPSGLTAALAAKRATTLIPILAVSVADPVKFGLVDSLARPGGNVTGLSQPLPDWGKFLELAREAVAGASRVAVIGNPTNVVYPDYVGSERDRRTSPRTEAADDSCSAS